MNTTLRRFTVSAVALMVGSATGRGVAAVAQPLPTNSTRVLVLFDEDRSLPGLAVLDRSLRATLTAGLDRVEFYTETLSLSQFSDGHHEDLVSQYLREKYRERQPSLIVAVMGPSLQYLLRHGGELFPGVPTVFCGADAADIRTVNLPKTVTGLLVRRTFAPTLDLALRLHPATAHVYVVGGTSPFDRHLQMSARRELQPFERRVAIEYLTDLAMTDLLARIKALPRNSLVLYLALFRDAAGNAFVPHNVVAELAATANAPMYVFVDQYVGLGPVGGFVYSVASHGNGAGQIALRVLHGASPATIPVTEFEGNLPLFDARQLRRWGLDESQLPPGSIVSFREPSLWRDYRREVLTGLAVLALQSLLMIGLLYQRRARRQAEVESRNSLALAADASRRVTMSALTGSIAHELSQPLSSILHNAQAGEMLVDSNRATPETVREILSEIHTADVRATEIVERHRKMLRTRQLEKQPIDIHSVVRESLALVAHDTRTNQVQVDVDLPGTPCVVAGDSVLLQQVLVNLVINAMEAMAEIPRDRRRVTVLSRLTEGSVEVSVRDAGTGLPANVDGRLFEPFVTTKKNGMGIGLTIARSIAEVHGGRMDAQNNPEGGATFTLTLPCIDTHGTGSSATVRVS